MQSSSKFETLDTSYVSLAALIHHLRERQFTGRLHVALDQYEADVFLRGDSAPHVRERDRLSGREEEGNAAFERLMVRAREPGGSITLFENDQVTDSAETQPERPVVASLPSPVEKAEVSQGSGDHGSLLAPTGELIAAVERAVQSAGVDFGDVFEAARVEMGDDYPFMDPTLGGFEYADGVVTLKARPSRAAFVNGITESLRRVVNRIGAARQGARFRERVAVELAIALRRDKSSLSDFSEKLDQIAGTRVL
jgi:hypothetical protein